jgi:hypothetical protein
MRNLSAFGVAGMMSLRGRLGEALSGRELHSFE